LFVLSSWFLVASAAAAIGAPPPSPRPPLVLRHPLGLCRRCRELAAAAAVGASTAYVSPFAFAAFCASTTFCLPLLLCHRCHPFVSRFAFAAAAIRASTAVVSPFAAAAIGATTALIPLCRGCNPHSFLEIFL
jgi:hypothetical protein